MHWNYKTAYGFDAWLVVLEIIRVFRKYISNVSMYQLYRLVW